MPLTAGTKLGPYEIAAPLGAGGMGEVYRARDPRLGRDVAVKVLPASLAGDADRLRRFENEARAAARLSHPNILQIYDVGRHEGHPYLVTELLEGRTLRERLAEGPMSPRRAIDFAIGVAQGLAAAHDEGIVHRDLKPENLFEMGDGRVKILDFGLAKLTRPEADGEGTVANAPTVGGDTEAGIVLGTVGYMSPEQVRGQPAEARSDIFTFGAILYEMVSGQRAFRGETPADTMSAILKEDPPELTILAKDIPPVLDRIVRRCLEKMPARRFRSAQDLAFSLEAISSESGSGAAPAVEGGSPRGEVSFQQLTFSRGYLLSGRLAPDGQTAIYAGRWEGGSLGLHMRRSETPDPIPIPLPKADVLAISSTGEMAIQLSPTLAHSGAYRGTLALAPMFGGAPRQLAEDVMFADFGPTGRDLLVVRDAGGKSYIEYPMGRVLYESSGHVSFARLSPGGDRIAFLDHPLKNDDRSSVAMIDLDGKKTTLTREWASAQGLAWIPSGKEIWFTATDSGVFRTNIFGVGLSGALRQVYAFLGSVRILDIAKGGNILLAREDYRVGILAKGPGDSAERELGWLDYSMPAELSPDGRTILFTESSHSVGRDYAVCARGMDGSPVIRLGEGTAIALSPDGRWAAAHTPYRDSPVELLPTGPGQKRSFSKRGFLLDHRAHFTPDSRRIVMTGHDERGIVRLLLLEVESGSLTPLPLRLERPDSRSTVALTPGGREALVLYRDTGESEFVPLDGAPGRPGPAFEKGDGLVAFSSDGAWIYVQAGVRRIPLPIDRIHVERGERENWRKLMPSDASGLIALGAFTMALDGEAYAYLCQRELSVLYVGQGLGAV
jgi:eukaryotic-like serine/threonine-protein kinase